MQQRIKSTVLIFLCGGIMGSIFKSSKTDDLFMAIRKGDEKTVEKIILKESSLANVKTSGGQTPLHSAKTKEIKMLLRRYGAK